MRRETIIILVVTSTLVATVAFAAKRLGSEVDKSAAAVAGSPVSNEAPTTPVAAPPAVVKTMTAALSDITETVSATGVTAPIREVTFSAEIAGRIEHTGAKLGDRIHKGQILARIDYETLQAEQSRARAAFDLAKATHDRLVQLGADIVSRQQIDEAYAGMISAKTALAIADNAAKKSIVRSNMTGIVTEKPAERGEFATPGAPLFRVVDYRTIVVEAQLAETEVASVRKGAKVQVRVDALDSGFSGKVKTILPMADAGSGTFTARIEIDNPDLRILVGMSAEIRVNARVHEKVVVVPQDVVIDGNGQRSVFVVNGSTAEERPVTLGPTRDHLVAIVEGIAPGEQIVVLGHRLLEDGQPIRIAN